MDSPHFLAEASHDHAQEEAARLMANARIAIAPVWPTLAAAESVADFDNRRELFSEQIAKACLAVAGNDLNAYTALLGQVQAQLEEDFNILHTAREAKKKEAAKKIAMQAGDTCPRCEKGKVTQEGGIPLYGTPMPKYLACDWCWATYDMQGNPTGKLGKTAGVYCKDHNVWIGDGNADTHEGCSKEQKATDKTKDAARKTAVWCKNCGEDIHKREDGRWIGDNGTPGCIEDANLMNFGEPMKGHIPEKRSLGRQSNSDASRLGSRKEGKQSAPFDREVAEREAARKEASPSGPNGYWCRACGEYQSIRSPADSKKAKEHIQAHIDAGEEPRDGQPWRKATRKEAVDQTTWQRDFDKYAQAIEAAGAIIDNGDGTQSFDPTKVPEEVAQGYTTLVQMGYANGFLASKQGGRKEGYATSESIGGDHWGIVTGGEYASDHFAWGVHPRLEPEHPLEEGVASTMAEAKAAVRAALARHGLPGDPDHPNSSGASYSVASKQAAWTNAWPAAPSTTFPGEQTLACPKCGSTDVTMTVAYGPGGRIGDPGSSDINICNACGHREIMRTATRKQGWTMQQVNQVVERKQYATVDGMILDLWTASAIKAVMDALSHENRVKAEQLPLPTIAEFAIKHTGARRQALYQPGDRVRLIADDHDPDLGWTLPAGTVLVVDEESAQGDIAGDTWIYAEYQGEIVAVDPARVEKVGSKKQAESPSDYRTCEKCGSTLFVGQVLGERPDESFVCERCLHAPKTAAFEVVDENDERVAGPFDTEEEAQSFIDQMGQDESDHGKDTEPTGEETEKGEFPPKKDDKEEPKGKGKPPWAKGSALDQWLCNPREGARRMVAQTAAGQYTKKWVKDWLLTNYLTTDAQGQALAQCVVDHADLTYFDAVVEKYRGMESGEPDEVDGEGFALTSLVETHEGPHNPDCPWKHIARKHAQNPYMPENNPFVPAAPTTAPISQPGQSGQTEERAYPNEPGQPDPVTDPAEDQAIQGFSSREKVAAYAAKIAEIAEGIAQTNPSIDPREAVAIAHRTASLYPAVVAIEEHDASEHEGMIDHRSRACANCGEMIYRRPGGVWLHTRTDDERCRGKWRQKVKWTPLEPA